MFRYNIPKSLIIEARKELKKDIDSNHPAVRKLQKQAEKISWRQAKFIWVAMLLGTLAFNLPSDIHNFRPFSVSSVFFTLFDILFLPTFVALLSKGISLLVFYNKNGIPVKTMPPSSSRGFSSKSSFNSSISVNPASGMPMCGSVDVNGNAPGHSHRY